MSQPIFAQTIGGAVNGVNLSFTTPTPYTPGTIAVLVNGILVTQSNDDGWIETSPATGGFQMKLPPLAINVTDKLSAFYLDTSTNPEIIEIFELFGTIEEVEGLGGRLETVDGLDGTADEFELLPGSLTLTAELIGVVEEFSTLDGSLGCA